MFYIYPGQVYQADLIFYHVFHMPWSGPPSKPKGPLEVTDVTKNSAKLAWKEPEDDGGVPIEYVAHFHLTHNFFFLTLLCKIVYYCETLSFILHLMSEFNY